MLFDLRIVSTKGFVFVEFCEFFKGRCFFRFYSYMLVPRVLDIIKNRTLKAFKTLRLLGAGHRLRNSDEIMELFSL